MTHEITWNMSSSPELCGGATSPINAMASPINVDIESPDSAPSPVDTTAKAMQCNAMDATSSAITVPCLLINDSPTIKAESPDSHCSAYSAVYSPVANSGAGSNVEGDCCNNSGLKMRRQRLRPWLIAQINSGEIPGLVWLDKENMIFKIPWKHFGRPGVDTYLDALLFRRWALHTKKFEQGRPSDISTWKTRFRCALHKLPDIEELNKQNVTDGEEPYRVYKFRKIELEKIPRDCSPDDEPESSVGSIGSPVSASYPVEPNFASPVSASYPDPSTYVSSEIYRASDTYRGTKSSVGSFHSSMSNQSSYAKHKMTDNHLSYSNKQLQQRQKIAGMQTADIQKWQHYDHLRLSISDECAYDDEEKSLRNKGVVKEASKYSRMDYETDDDERSWTLRNSGRQMNPPLPKPVNPVSSIGSRYETYYSHMSPKERGFEPFERRNKNIERMNESNEVGVIKNAKSTKLHISQETYEEDDNELFFQSCAKRIKKLDSKSSGYLKLKILEQFYYVENFQHTQGHQSYRYSSDPPPLISSAIVRTTEQLLDVDEPALHEMK